MSRHPLGGALRVSEEPPRAASLAGVERLWPGPFTFQNANVGLQSLRSSACCRLAFAFAAATNQIGPKTKSERCMSATSFRYSNSAGLLCLVVPIHRTGRHVLIGVRQRLDVLTVAVLTEVFKIGDFGRVPFPAHRTPSSGRLYPRHSRSSMHRPAR